jgi:hypothetical protein
MALKHVGRIASTKRKVIVAYKVLPGEPNDCVVVTTENLEAGDHDALIQLVESSAGQEAEDLATVMMRTTLSDGGNMLARFHKTGKMIKIKTADVEMIPNRNSSIRLNELNEAIAQQRGVTVNDLAIKSNSGETIPLLNEKSDGPVITASEMAAAAPSVAPVADEGVITDEALAKKFRSDADRLSKEAAELRRQAEELVPTKKKAVSKKTVSSA